jgi:tetratricopeptide (TPR) repeat protein
MKVMTWQRVLLSLTLCLNTSWLLVSTSAWAKQPELSAATLRRVQRVDVLRQGEQYAQAIDLLLGSRAQRPYDQAFIQWLLGYLYWQLEQPEPAIGALTQAVESGALPEPEHKQTLRMLADLLLMQGRDAEAERDYLALIALNGSAQQLEPLWLRVAQAQYRQQKWLDVEGAVGKQQALAAQMALEPQTAPLNLLLGAQLAQQKWHAAISTAEQLRDIEPTNALWWRQLTSLYTYADKPNKALLTLQQAERLGLVLSDADKRLLAHLYAYAQLPYQAAQLYGQLDGLDESAEGLAQQAGYWQAAKEWERARLSWLKAAKVDGRYCLQLAQLDLYLKDYEQALQAIAKLPEQTDQTLLLKAQALHALGQNAQAYAAAQAAHKLNPTDESARWSHYLSQITQHAQITH